VSIFWVLLAGVKDVKFSRKTKIWDLRADETEFGFIFTGQPDVVADFRKKGWDDPKMFSSVIMNVRGVIINGYTLHLSCLGYHNMTVWGKKTI